MFFFIMKSLLCDFYVTMLPSVDAQVCKARTILRATELLLGVGKRCQGFFNAQFGYWNVVWHVKKLFGMDVCQEFGILLVVLLFAEKNVG